jgi:Ni/Co efflux regulator RcnB
MTKSSVKTLRRIGLVCGAGLIAISASTFAGIPGPAAAPAVSTNQQVAEGQQQQNPPLLKQQQEQKNKDLKNKNQMGGQLQYRQGGQQGGQQQWGQQGGQQGGQQQWGQQGGQQGGQQQWGQQGGQQGGQQPYQQGGQQGGQQQWGQQGGQQGGQQQWGQQGHRYDWSAYRPGQRPPQWQQYQQGFNPRPYQWNQYADHSYRWQPYVQPRGWYYRHWAYGERLPSFFWGRQYWMDNYWQFGLIDPPYGYVWVRYGNDAMLVAVETGLILGAIYWLFY